MAQIAPLGRYRAFDADGNPLAGGKLYTYEAGTSTPKATFTDKSGTTPNANPVILDADGYADVWLDVGGYKFSLFDANDVLQFTVDDIDGGAAGGFASQVVSRSSSFSLGVNEQNVVNVCTSPLTVSLLPAATAGDGFASIIVNLSGGNVTIDPDGAETINNASTLVIGDGNSATLSTDGVEWYAFGYTQSELRDNQFRIIDNADTTKKLAFEVSGIAAGTTRTITVTDTSLAIPANATAPSSLILAEDTDNGVNTVQIIAPSAVTSNRVLTLPDETGTVVSTARTASDTQAGIVELATTAETQTGTDTTRAVTPAGLLAAFSHANVYESGELSITTTPTTVTHNLGRKPRHVEYFLRCKTAQYNYAVGDEVMFGGQYSNDGGAFVHGIACCIPNGDVNSIIVLMGNSFTPLMDKTTGAVTGGITSANWRVVVRVWA